MLPPKLMLVLVSNSMQKVNDRTDAVVRVKGAYEFGDASKSSTVTMDRAYVNHKFGERVSAKAGRFGQTFGAGLAYDAQFDGAQFNAGNDKIGFQAAYGYIIWLAILMTASSWFSCNDFC